MAPNVFSGLTVIGGFVFTVESQRRVVLGEL